jgi:hypothetical protein
MKGFREQPQATRKEQLKKLNVELQNMQMAGRISQMMIQQLLQNNKALSEDLGRAMGLINELQYKVLAVQKVSNLDVTALSKVADDLRLRDFNEASDNEDTSAGFTVGDTVLPDSTVILTSEANGNRGIFRSRIKLSESGSKELIDGFAGKPVGTKITVQLNGEEHVVELLGIRNPKVEVTTPAAADVVDVTPETQVQ